MEKSLININQCRLFELHNCDDPTYTNKEMGFVTENIFIVSF